MYPAKPRNVDLLAGGHGLGPLGGVLIEGDGHDVQLGVGQMIRQLFVDGFPNAVGILLLVAADPDVQGNGIIGKREGDAGNKHHQRQKQGNQRFLHGMYLLLY